MIKLSICIPIFNTDIRPLGNELNRQIQSFSSEVELLFLDDASDVRFQETNRSVGAFSHYIELPKNIGRSKIRNAFLPLVKGEFLLFLDGDSEIIRPDFIEKYLQFIQQNEVELLVGGREEVKTPVSRSQKLRWEYSRKRESKSTEERIKDEKSGFKSNNFIVRKSVFEHHLFDESITTYGHEDTLFGYQLRKKGIYCWHIDNPVLNDDLVDNVAFLQKTNQALLNLQMISQKLNDSQFNEEQKLLNLALKIHKSALLERSLLLLSKGLQPVLYKWLAKGYFSLWMFDLYRFMVLQRLIAHG